MRKSLKYQLKTENAHFLSFHEFLISKVNNISKTQNWRNRMTIFLCQRIHRKICTKLCQNEFPVKLFKKTKAFVF